MPRLTSLKIFFLTAVLFFGILSILILLSPVIIIVILVRCTEQCVYSILYGARLLPSENVVWMTETRENNGDINGCVTIDGDLSINTLSKLIDDNLIKSQNKNGENIYWQVTKYVIPGYVNYYWIEEDNFDLREHVHEHTVEPITSEKDINELILKGCTLDNPTKSPWEFVLIPYLDNGHRKTVITFRVAHVIADGASIAYFLLCRLAESDHPIDLSQLRVPKYLQGNRLVRFIKALWEIPLVMKETLFVEKDSNAFDKVLPTGNKYISCSKPLDLKRIKDAKNKLGTTVNDVILGWCSKSFNDVFTELDEYCPKELSMFTAFNMRLHIDEAKDFNNKIAILAIKLATNHSDLKLCINAMKRKMDALKSSSHPLATYLIWKFLSYIFIPKVMIRKMIADIVNSGSLASSYVVGPQQEIKIAGHTVESMVYWPPTFNVPAMVSFCCYNNKLRIGVASDRALFVNADKLIEIFEKNFDNIGTI